MGRAHWLSLETQSCISSFGAFLWSAEAVGCARFSLDLKAIRFSGNKTRVGWKPEKGLSPSGSHAADFKEHHPKEHRHSTFCIDLHSTVDSCTSHQKIYQCCITEPFSRLV